MGRYMCTFTQSHIIGNLETSIHPTVFRLQKETWVPRGMKPEINCQSDCGSKSNQVPLYAQQVYLYTSFGYTHSFSGLSLCCCFMVTYDNMGFLSQRSCHMITFSVLHRIVPQTRSCKSQREIHPHSSLSPRSPPLAILPLTFIHFSEASHSVTSNATSTILHRVK